MNRPGWSLAEKRDPLSGAILKMYRHKAGFHLDILPRPGFARRFGSICIPYGSIHGAWLSKGRRTVSPPGTAHYLEHCVFSKEEGGGLLSRLSSLGADANAYTSHTHTMYHFTAVERFDESLFTFFDAVMSPALTEERIESERGVILAEIDMYLDDPDSRAYNAVLESLYAGHPVRTDIAGTPETVRAITGAQLTEIASRFYRPAAATVTLVGDIDEEAILDGFDRRMETTGNGLPSFDVLDEPLPVRNAGQSLAMDVGTPSFLIGFKDSHVLPRTPMEGTDLVERKLSGRLLAETLMGPSSSLFNDLYDKGLLNDSFGFQYVCERDFAYLIVGGESASPEASAGALLEGLSAALARGADSALFEIQKRAAAGDFLRSMDHVRQCGMAAAQAALNRVDLFEYPAIYDRINAQQSVAAMGFLSDPERIAIVYITQKTGEEST